jgi:hypothetical protein
MKIRDTCQGILSPTQQPQMNLFTFFSIETNMLNWPMENRLGVNRVPQIFQDRMHDIEQNMSNKMPDFRFMLSSADSQTRILHSGFLKSAVPLCKDSSILNIGSSTYESYLTAIQTFIVENFEEFAEVVKKKAQWFDKEIQLIDLVAEKRGADYFPASVRVHTGQEQLWFVANVALTDRGISRIKQDYDLMRFLGTMGDQRFVPEVYFLSDSSDRSSNITETPNLMFLGEWFRGYHEFHVSSLVPGKQTVFTFWDTDNGYREITEDVAVTMIERVAYILTYFFDLESLREIYPWHLAAGDFIAKLSPNPDLKLITVRQYGNRIIFTEDSHENINDALLMFLANITVRARLDRIDGVGDLVWLGDGFLEAIMRGFIKGIIAKNYVDRDLTKFCHNFVKIVRSKTIQEWTEVFVTILESYDKRAPDFKIISKNLVDHIFTVFQNWQTLSFADEIISLEDIQV